MNVATFLTLTACAIEVVMGSLALAFAGAQGWRHFKVFAPFRLPCMVPETRCLPVRRRLRGW